MNLKLPQALFPENCYHLICVNSSGKLPAQVLSSFGKLTPVHIALLKGICQKWLVAYFFLTLQLSKKVIQVGLKTGKGKTTKFKIKQGKIGQMRYSWENLKTLTHLLESSKANLHSELSTSQIETLKIPYTLSYFKLAKFEKKN